MDDKKGYCRKPPVPVDRLRCHACTINPAVRALLLKIDKVYKVKGKWCHNFTKALAQLVLTKLHSRRPSKKKKPDTSLTSLHLIARSFAIVVKCVLKVGGQWSDDYNDDIIQLALTLLRSSLAPSNNTDNPLALAVAVGTANKLPN